MPQTGQEAVRDEVRRAGLPADGPLPGILAMLRMVEDTHLDLAEALRIATAGGLVIGRAEMGDALEALVAHGLLGRVPVIGRPPIYDTIAHCHSHLLDDATATIVDLDVSAETLSAIIRQAIADQPGRVEVLLRIRAPPRPADAEAPRLARGPGRPRRGSPGARHPI